MKKRIRSRARVERFIHRAGTAEAKVHARGHEGDVHTNGNRTEGFAVIRIDLPGTEVTAAFNPDGLRKLRAEIDDALGVAELFKQCTAQHCDACKTGLFHPDYNKPKIAPVVEAPPVHFTTEPTK